MEINIVDKQNALILSISGRLDALTAPELEETISKQIESAGKSIILDFDNLDYISSAGLRVVLFSAKQLKTKKMELILSGLKESVKDVFELSGFYSIFKIFETPDIALEQI